MTEETKDATPEAVEPVRIVPEMGQMRIPAAKWTCPLGHVTQIHGISHTEPMRVLLAGGSLAVPCAACGTAMLVQPSEILPPDVGAPRRPVMPGNRHQRRARGRR